MKIGMIGLGTMGGDMAARLIEGKHTVVGFDASPSAVSKAAERGVTGTASIDELLAALEPPRMVWLMVPAGDPVDETIESLLPGLDSNDIIIDGGNSNYKDTMRRSAAVGKRGLRYVDAGTSGGIWGLTQGYSLMIGGDPKVIDELRPIFETLAPGPDRGWGRVGPTGSGHFVKMVHNGIEYGLMQAYAEGLAVLHEKKDYELDLHQVAEIWRYGSVVRSWLLDLTAKALEEDAELSGIAPYVADSGEGRWTVKEALDLDVPAPVITLSLQERLRSRLQDSFADKLLAAMRHEFGGHAMHHEETR